MSAYRARGTSALSTVLKNTKNIASIEAAVYKVTDDEDHYLITMLQAIEDIKSRVLLNPLLASITAGEIGWNHASNKELALKMEERDLFVADGVEVEEGVLQCKKCKSWHVHSTSENTRGGDEGQTVFAQCANCKESWVERG